MGRVSSFIASLIGVKGKDGSTVASAANPVPVEIENTVAVTGPLTDTQIRATPVPVSGTIATTPPTNASTNLTQVGGVAVSLGAKTSAASIPVVLATDESALPVTGTFYQATQPVSAASLPLPSGASTLAKQPALGTAGIASADVLSVQGIASMTPLKTDGSATTQPVSGAVTANAGTNLNTSALALETGGHLASIDTHIPALGQALAAASVPVILPSATITTLTPPAAITGFALEAGHLATIDTNNADIQDRTKIGGSPRAGERKRYDMPSSFTSGTLYVGWNASASAATSAASWIVRRVVFDANGNPSDDQVQTAIAWDSRTSGWTA